MKTILDKIVEQKRVEVLHSKQRVSVEELEKRALFSREPIDVKACFCLEKPGIIAEFKRKSPSKGIINDVVNPVEVVSSYKKGGALVSSILTDEVFFGGTLNDLQSVKEEVEAFPLLRKDFMIDPYQITEAKAHGADMILLIAAILEKEEVSSLAKEAHRLGLSVLLEVHDEHELDKWVPEISLLGVNNRNLKDFTVDIERSLKLLPKFPTETIKISESGLQKTEDVKMLFEAGFNGFLMGENFMKEDDPGKALKDFTTKL